MYRQLLSDHLEGVLEISMDQGKQKVRSSKDRTQRANHQNDVQLRLLEKDGQKLMWR